LTGSDIRLGVFRPFVPKNEPTMIGKIGQKPDSLGRKGGRAERRKANMEKLKTLKAHKPERLKLH